MKTGIELIAEERQEQIEKHGFDENHDARHDKGILRVVAATLCCIGTDAIVNDHIERGSGDNCWGLEKKLRGEANTIHRLKVAGALIAAEIDRLQIND